MRLPAASLIVTAVLACTASTWAQVAPANPAGSPARDAFRNAHPGTEFLVLGDQLARVYGHWFSNGATPEASADAFLAAHADIYGVKASDLAPFGPFEGGEHLVPLMPEDDGAMKFTAVYYTQTVKGVPVFRANVSVLCRNEPGFPAVLAGSTLWDLGTFADTFTGAPAALPAYRTLARNTMGRFAGQPQTFPASYVIWAGIDRIKAAQPALAVQFEAEGTGVDGEPARWLFVVDARTGALLYEEDRISHYVTGTIKGTATPGYNADACATATQQVLPYAKIANGATTVYADANGAYSIAAGTLVTTLGGKYFTVQNNGAATAVSVSSAQSDGATYNPLLNAANTVATDRAQVNAYIAANTVRDMVLGASPSYPTVSTQSSSFIVNCNLASTCNAYYSANTINFYAAGGGCNNTAFGTVVHHEYGHNVVEKGGSGQGQYGEGMGDVHGLLIADVAVTGVGFQTCSAGIRTAANTCQFSSTGCSSCGSEIHACGQLISGCVWDLRNKLYALDPAGYMTLLRRLVINSIPLHGAISTIDADIPVDYLTLDDNDGNISNGTPHYSQISYAFTVHGIAVPAIAGVQFSFPQGLPSTVKPNGTTTLQVSIAPLSGTPNTTTAKLYTKSGAATSYTATPMTYLGSNLYSVNVPAGTCNDVASMYFAVTTTGGVTQNEPSTAPASVYSATYIAQSLTVLNEAFEGADTGWTVGAAGDTATNGLWVRGAPNGTGWFADGSKPVQPGSNHTTGGTNCWFTGQGAGGYGSTAVTEADVDGGSTTLVSPTLDGSALDVANIHYFRWVAAWQNSAGLYPLATDLDGLVVELSGDNGATWTTVDTVRPSSSSPNSNGWVEKVIRVNDYFTPNATMRLRFRANDGGYDSQVEVAIDDLSIEGTRCTALNPADLNLDGHVNGGDLGILLSQWGTAGSADLNHDGIVDGNDLGQLLAAWTN
jgi:hypothetical protein